MGLFYSDMLVYPDQDQQLTCLLVFDEVELDMLFAFEIREVLL